MDIVCVAFPAWEGNYLKSTVQLMKELAHENRVLYVDYAYTWKDFFNSLLGKSFGSWKRMMGLEPRLREVEIDNGATLHVLTLPPVIPVNFIKNPSFYDKINAINAYFIEKTIQKAMRQLGMTAPSVINAFNPAYGIHLAEKLNEKRLIYYCYDEIGAANWAKQHGERLENQFLKLVDTVIVTSQGLFDKKSKQHPNCHLVKNGVDYELFSQKIDPSVLPNILNKNNKKIVGYLGSVDERLDYTLLEKVIGATPQYQYVFVGRVTEPAFEKTLSQFNNVYLAGPQPPTTLPAWVQSFDVCLIPFAKNELTAGIYPLKINEYLAAGKAVISTHFADLRDFEHIITIVEDAQDLINCLEAENNSYAIERTQFASQNSWKARAESLKSYI